MKIKMLSVAAGPDGVWLVGSVQDVSAQVGQPLVDGGYAEEVMTKPKPARHAQPSLQSIEGIGPKTAEELAAVGVDSVEALALAEVDELVAVLSVSNDKAADWIASALKLVGEDNG